MDGTQQEQVAGPTAQVVIAGAGPVGLMLAIELRIAGVDVLVLERRATGTSGESRAPGISARTMELFQQRGLRDAVTAQGKPLTWVVFGGVPLDPHEEDPDWPDGWILPQHETERILAERAVGLGARIRWSTAVEGLEQAEDGVRIRVVSAEGRETIDAAYLVGCDGGRSTVRKAAGIDFPGVPADTWWVVGDLELADPPDAARPFGFNDVVGRYQLSQTEPGWFRLNLMRTTPPADPAAPVTLDEVRQVMLEGLGTDHGLRSARWMSRWSDGFRHAAAYRRGRVLIAGDAAHTHSPVGGQGLNTGLQDAVNLGWKLAAVLAGHAPDRLLDTYQDERWPVAERVLTQSMAQTELVKPGPRRAAMRQVVEELLEAPEAARRVCADLSGLGMRYDLGEGHPLLGRRMPNLPVELPGGGSDVLGLLEDGRPLLLSLTPEVATRLDAVAARWTRPVRHVAGRIAPRLQGAGWWVPVFGEVPPFDAVLVRPDGYVAWVAPAGAAPDLPSLALAATHREAPQEAAPPAPDGADPADGTWRIVYTTPRGEQHAVLELHCTAAGRTGLCNGEAVTRLTVDGTSVSFTSRVREPFPTKVRWAGTISGDSMSGTARTSFMTLPFTATREADPRAR